ncbi:MAG: hypothetical protein NC541_15860, partial [bacterium]|nr:hypothetical protein [bacterium]
MKSFPFDSEITFDQDGMPLYDRASNSEELREYYHLLYTDGVFPDPSTGLQVTEYSQEMSVAVQPGSVMIQGAMGIEKNTRILVFEAAGNNYDRIDSVVARLNTNYDHRKIDLYVIKGVEATSPTAPELTREGGIYELRLANVFIAKNTTAISTERITDTRLNQEDCGIVTSNPNPVDTTTIFTQYQSALDNFLTYADECVDGTIIGKMQKEIDDLKEMVQKLQESRVTCTQAEYDAM